MKIIKNIGVVTSSIILSLIIPSVFLDPIHSLFSKLYGVSNGDAYQGAAEFLLAFILSFVFFNTLLFTAFDNEKKYWWIGVLLIPAAAFELYFDWQHIYIPIILGLVGWFGGWLISKAMTAAK